MAAMTSKGKTMSRKLSEGEIDEIVVGQAGDDAAWEKPFRVKKAKSASLSISADLAARAAFLARLHREPGLEAWLTRIIRERVELEEIAFGQAKRDLAANSTA